MANSVLSINTNGSQSIIPINDKLSNPVLSNATTVTETIVARWQLPANFIYQGINLSSYVSFISGGIGTITYRFRIGTTGTITDALACQLNTSAAQAVNSRGRADFSIYANTNNSLFVSGFASMGTQLLGQIVTPLNNITVTPTAPIFLSITMQNSVASTNLTPSAGLNAPIY